MKTVRDPSKPGWHVIPLALLGAGLAGGLIGAASVVLEFAGPLLTSIYIGAALLAAAGLFWLGMLTRRLPKRES